MWNMIWPILIAVGANTVYNIATKSTPQGINTFASLFVSYITAAVGSVILFFITAKGKSFSFELGKINWTAFALGIAIVGLEFGFLCIYRSGWKISIANLFTSIILACILLIIGLLFYKESLTVKQILGIFVCALGLFLIVK